MGTTSLTPDHTSRLNGRTLTLARAGWIVVAGLSIAIFIGGVIQSVGGLAGEADLIRQAGFSPALVAAIRLIRVSLFTLVYVVTGAIIFWRKSDEAMALVTSLMLIVFGTMAFSNVPPAVTAELTALKSTNQAVDTWDAEVRLAQWDLAHESQAAGNLGSLPVIVLWAGHPEMTSPDDRMLLKAIHDSVPAFSTSTIVRVIDQADHGSIQGKEQNAGHISDAIREGIEAARTGQPLK